MINLQTQVIFSATGQANILNAFQQVREHAERTGQAVNRLSQPFTAFGSTLQKMESGMIRVTGLMLKLQQVMTLTPGGGNRGSVFWATWGAQGLMDLGAAAVNAGTAIIGMYSRATVASAKYKNQLAEIVALEQRYGQPGAMASENRRTYRLAQAIGAPQENVAEARFQLASAPIRGSLGDPSGSMGRTAIQAASSRLALAGASETDQIAKAMVTGISGFQLDPRKDAMAYANLLYGLDRSGLLRPGAAGKAVSKIAPGVMGLAGPNTDKMQLATEAMSMWAFGTNMGMTERESSTATGRIFDVLFKSANPETKEGQAHRRIFGSNWTPETAMRMGMPAYFQRLTESGFDPFTDIVSRPAARLMGGIVQGYRTTGANGETAGLSYADIVKNAGGTNDLAQVSEFMSQLPQQQIQRLKNEWQQLLMTMTEGAANFIAPLTKLVKTLREIPGIAALSNITVIFAAGVLGIGKLMNSLGRMFNMFSRLSVAADGFINQLTHAYGGAAAPLNMVNERVAQVSNPKTPIYPQMWHPNGFISGFGSASGTGTGGVGGGYFPAPMPGMKGGSPTSSNVRWGLAQTVANLSAFDPASANRLASGILSTASDHQLLKMLSGIQQGYGFQKTMLSGQMAGFELETQTAQGEMGLLQGADKRQKDINNLLNMGKGLYNKQWHASVGKQNSGIATAHSDHAARVAAAHAKRTTYNPLNDPVYVQAVADSEKQRDVEIADITKTEQAYRDRAKKRWETRKANLEKELKVVEERIRTRPQRSKQLQAKLADLQRKHSDASDQLAQIEDAEGASGYTPSKVPPLPQRVKASVGSFLKGVAGNFTSGALGAMTGTILVTTAISGVVSAFNQLREASVYLKDTLASLKLTPDQIADVTNNPGKYAAPDSVKDPTTRFAWNANVESTLNWETGLSREDRVKKLAKVIKDSGWSLAEMGGNTSRAKMNLKQGLESAGVLTGDVPKELLDEMYTVLNPGHWSKSGSFQPESAANFLLKRMEDLNAGRRVKTGVLSKDLGADVTNKLGLYEPRIQGYREQAAEQERTLEDLLGQNVPDKQKVDEATASLRETNSALYQLFGEMENLVDEAIQKGGGSASPEVMKQKKNYADQRADALKAMGTSTFRDRLRKNFYEGRIAEEAGVLQQMKISTETANLGGMDPRRSISDLEMMAAQQERILNLRIQEARELNDSKGLNAAISDLQENQLQTMKSKLEIARQIQQDDLDKSTSMLDIQKSYSEYLVSAGAPQGEVNASRARERSLRGYVLQSMLATAQSQPAGPLRDKMMLDWQRQRIAYAREELDIQNKQNESLSKFLMTLRETMVERAMVMRRGMPDFSDFMVGLKTSFAYMATMKDYLGNMRLNSNFMSGGLQPSLAASAGNYNAARQYMNVAPTFNIPVYAQSDAARAVDIINKTLVPQIQSAVNSSFGAMATTANAQAQYSTAQQQPRYSAVPVAQMGAQGASNLFSGWRPFTPAPQGDMAGYQPQGMRSPGEVRRGEYPALHGDTPVGNRWKTQPGLPMGEVKPMVPGKWSRISDRPYPVNDSDI